MNRKFGKLVDGQLVYAPNMVSHDGRSYINPKEPDYFKADDGPWYPIEPLPPPSTPPAEGYHYVRNGEVFDEEHKCIVPQYAQVENPPASPRTFSKFKVVRLLTERGIWVKVRDYIVTKGLYDLFLAAQDFKEDDKFFIEGLTSLKGELGLSDEQVEEILKNCEV